MLLPGRCTVKLSSGGTQRLHRPIFLCSACPPILSRAALILQKLSRTLSGSIAGYTDDRCARGGLHSLLETDCHARCCLCFSAVAQRKCERLVSLRRRALPRCPTLALAQTFTVWRHSKFPLILVPPSSLAVGLGDSAGRLSTLSGLRRLVGEPPLLRYLGEASS